MKLIPLTQGMFAKVDDMHLDRIASFATWHVVKMKHMWYAYTKINNVSIPMHSLVLSVPEGFEVDHINRDSLDNQAHNLRQATTSQNSMNKTAQSNNKIGYKGVVYLVQNRKYRAMVTKDGKRYNVGSYLTPEEAARAYDAKAKELFGVFAFQNFTN